MENAILDTVSFLEDVDFSIVFKALGIGLILFWLVIVGWAAFDASQRYTSIWARLFSIVLVLFLPFFGLLIYLVVRPKVTREEAKWMNLEQRYLRYETAGLDDCPRCGYEIRPDFIFCPNCSKDLRIKCSMCDVYLEPHWGTCPFCGAEQKIGKKMPLENQQVQAKESKEKKAEKSRSQKRTAESKPKKDLKVSGTSDVEKDNNENTPLSKARKESRGYGKVRIQFERVMISVDRFVQSVGSIPMRVVGRSDSRKDSEKEQVM